MRTPEKSIDALAKTYDQHLKKKLTHRKSNKQDNARTHDNKEILLILY